MNYLEKNKEQYIKDLAGLIEIQSYLKDPQAYPNPEMIKAVEYMTKLGEAEGFKTYADPEGYYGWIEMGQGEEMIGILGHLDVVPPGEEIERWEKPPFELTVEGDNLRGRGTQDDKGPVMLGFYLMKSFIEEGIELNKRVRLIFPTDEESFWRGVEKYKADGQEVPVYGITPDSAFPLIYSERELWEFKIIGKPTDEFMIKAGAALNVVPDKADFKCFDCGKEITTEGAASHAMKPHEGENAITKLISEVDKDHDLIDFIRNEIIFETNGETLFDGLVKDDDAELTVNLATLNINEDVAEMAFDLRIPSTSSAKELEDKLKAKLEEKYPNLQFEEYDFLQGVYIPRDSELVKTLMGAYQEVTGDKETMPIATGGATYARGMDNIVAFGPFFSDSPETEHQYNEYARFSDFVKAFDIYSIAFKKFIK